jgi:Flp pilus assembly protein TadG
MTPHRRGREGDRGTMTLELAIITPVFVGFMMLLAGLGRMVDVQSQIDGAARDAARAASVARDRTGPGGAQDMAQQAALSSLGGNGWCTNGPTVSTNLSDWNPGGQVTVTVHCDVSLGDVAWIGFPGNKLMHGSATAPIDKYTYRNSGGGG